MINGVPLGQGAPAAPPADAKATSCGPIELNLDIRRCDVLNAGNRNALDAVLQGGGELSSDCDEQLLITVAFTTAVKLHSIIVEGPESAPSELRLFVNQVSMSFDDAEQNEPMQTLALDQASVAGKPTLVKYVKFQNVSTMSIFVPENLAGSEVTVLHRLRFIGQPIDTTNMSDLKKMG